MSNEKRIIAVPRQLQWGDPIFQVVARPLDEHLGDRSKSELEFFEAKPTIINKIETDPNNPKNLLFNDRISLPAEGRLEYADGVILNEKDAREAVLNMYKKEEKKALQIVEKAERELQALRDAKAIFEGKQTLNKKGASKIVVVSDANPDPADQD